jgi:hypothetical protein
MSLSVCLHIYLCLTVRQFAARIIKCCNSLSTFANRFGQQNAVGVCLQRLMLSNHVNINSQTKRTTQSILHVSLMYVLVKVKNIVLEKL